jgi:hypothetical protein
LIQPRHRHIGVDSFKDGVTGYERRRVTVGSESQVHEVENWRRARNGAAAASLAAAAMTAAALAAAASASRQISICIGGS